MTDLEVAKAADLALNLIAGARRKLASKKRVAQGDVAYMDELLQAHRVIEKIKSDPSVMRALRKAARC